MTDLQLKIKVVQGEVSFGDLRIRYVQQPYLGRRIYLSFQNGWREITVEQDLRFDQYSLDGVPIKISGSSWGHTGAENIAKFVTLVHMAQRLTDPENLNLFFKELEKDPSTEKVLKLCSFLFSQEELGCFPVLEDKS